MTLTDTHPDTDLTPPPAARALPGQRYAVELEDGSSFVVRTTNRDRVAWDMTRSKRNWPGFAEAPFLATTFVCWNAAKRDGQTTLTFDQFTEQVAAADPVEDPAGADVTDPTNPGPPPISS